MLLKSAAAQKDMHIFHLSIEFKTSHVTTGRCIRTSLYCGRAKVKVQVLFSTKLLVALGVFGGFLREKYDDLRNPYM